MLANYPAVAVTWHRGRLSDLFRHAGWTGKFEGREFEFLFERSGLDAIPRDLRVPEVGDAFFAALANTRDGGPFLEWFGQVAGFGPRFDLHFGRKEWSIPWELLIERLHFAAVRRRVAVVRHLGNVKHPGVSALDAKLRTLLLLGADSPPDGPPLQLGDEAETVCNAWRQLDRASQARVEEPIIERVTEANLAARVAELRPHVILYSGHGSSRPSSIQMADNAWLGSKTFAMAITSRAWTPLYVGFWACSTARDDDAEARLADAPSFAEQLIKRGVISVLAMQSPVGDVNATSLARVFFERIASGHTMERAVAEARAVMLERAPTGGRRFDWASPVVWTASEGVAAIQWDSAEARLIQRQLAGRRFVEAGERPVAASGRSGRAFEHEARLLARATAWSTARAVWVNGDPTDGLHNSEWTRSLAALQAVDTRAVIAPEFTSATQDALAEWAERLGASFGAAELPDDIAEALEGCRQFSPRGWKRLCHTQGIILAISGALPDEADAWFWDPLRDSGVSVLVLCLDRAPVAGHAWQFDSLGTPMNQQVIDAAVSVAPRLSRALAMLNAPIADEFVLIEPNAHARMLSEWAAGQAVLVRLPTGVVLKTEVRQRLLAQLSAEETTQAHYDAAALLGNEAIWRTPEIRSERVRHLAGARSGATAEAVRTLDGLLSVEIDRLCSIYRETSQARALVALYSRVRATSPGINDLLLTATRLDLAWAQLRLGKPQHARYWLDRAHPDEPLDKAFKHGLLAEILKSDAGGGAKDAVLAQIDEAISNCETAVADAQATGGGLAHAQGKLRAYQQDRARILHFLFHDVDGAIRAYEDLLAGWANQPFASLDMAVVRRNLSEALRRKSEAPDDDAARRANLQITQALSAARQFPNTPALAEIEYEAARDASHRGDRSGERAHLRLAAEAAGRSGFAMVGAIVANREFWSFEDFSEQRWRDISDRLAGHPAHGWAVRTLIDGLLCAADRFVRGGDLVSATSEISRAREALEPHPLFTGGSDRWRRAAIAAGASIVGDPEAGSIWLSFIQHADWVQGWLTENGVVSPQAAWRRRIGDTCRSHTGG